MCIVAMKRNASKHPVRRSQRTTNRRYFFWNHANVRSAWKRGTSFLSGLPRGFLVFQTRLGIWARIPRLRSCCRRTFASYPLSVARTLKRFRGLPALPVRTLIASNSGRTCARSSPLAGVVRLDTGMPAASVSVWMRMPLPLPPRATPAPPPLPGGKRAIDRPILPLNQPPFLCNAKQPRLHRCQGSIVLPTLQPAMRSTLRGPRRTAWDIAPAAAGDEHIQQRIHHPAQWCWGHPPPPLHGRWRKDVRKKLPFQIAQTLESSCHRALLSTWRTH